jgi:hypothetical protein
LKGGGFDIKNLRSVAIRSFTSVLCGAIALCHISCLGPGYSIYPIHSMSFTDNGNGTVTDNNTELMWQKQDDDKLYNWYQASGIHHATYNQASQNVCGELTLGGYSDWRLPSEKELITIVDVAKPDPGPKINTTYFPNTKLFIYWSSTAVVLFPFNKFGVNFNGGHVYDNGKRYGSYVRCVRSGQQ